MQATSEVKRKNDAQIPYTGPKQIISTSTDYRGNTMSDQAFFLSPGDTAVNVTNDSTDNYTITMPAPTEAEGKVYVVRATLSTSGDVIVDESDDSIDNDALPKTLGTTLDYIVLLCQAGKWFILDSETD